MLGSLLLATGRRSRYPMADAKDTFSPPDIGGLAFWFDAQAITTLYTDAALTTPVTADSQMVGGWVDKSNGNNLVQSTGLSRPAYRQSAINGRPGVESDGVDDFLRYSGAALPQPMTVYVVSKLALVAANAVWFDAAFTVTDRLRLFISAASQRSINAGSALIDGTPDTTPGIQTAIFNGANSSFYLNGAVVASGDAGSYGLAGITLFANRTGSGNLSGVIGEFLIYSSAHSPAQQALVEGYLRARWAL